MLEEQKNKIENQVEEAAQQAGGILRSRFGLWALALLSFIESALLIPMVIDPFMVAYILANKKSMWRGVIVTTIFSILGAVVAYFMALFFYEYIAEQYLTGAVADEFSVIVEAFQEGVFWITLVGAVTPIPYTLVALGAGFTEASLLIFLAASLLGRGGRFLFVGYLTEAYGDRALAIARRNIFTASVIVVGLAIFYLFFLH